MRSYSIFAVLFLIIPILEIYLLIQVGGIIGAFPTIILVVLTAVIGAGLLRQQGLSTLARFQQNLSQGKLPAQELIEGILLAVGGALLMTPGFVTDTIGFLCLIPFTRQLIATTIMKNSAAKVTAKMGGFTQGTDTYQTHADVFEGEFTEIKDEPIIISPDSSSTNNKNSTDKK